MRPIFRIETAKRIVEQNVVGRLHPLPREENPAKFAVRKAQQLHLQHRIGKVRHGKRLFELVGTRRRKRVVFHVMRGIQKELRL